MLDLFSRAQGTAVGFARAGFTVTASDINTYDKHPEIAHWITADARDVLDDVEFCSWFDVIAAGPKCQAYTTLRTSSARAGKEHEQQIWWVREKLIRIGKPYVIENVAGARWAMRDPVMLCGSMFGLGAMCSDGNYRQLRRHRLFESNVVLSAPGPCAHARLTGGVYGTGGTGQMTRGYKLHHSVGVYGHGSGHNDKGYSGSKSEASEAMGIDWMRRDDLAQAIPPVYTQWLGHQLIRHLQ